MTFQFENFHDFMTMSGHGSFVWASYGVAIALLLWLVFRPLIQKSRFLRNHRQQQKLAEVRRKQAVSQTPISGSN